MKKQICAFLIVLCLSNFILVSGGKAETKASGFGIAGSLNENNWYEQWDLSDKMTVKKVGSPDPAYSLKKGAATGTTSWQK